MKLKTENLKVTTCKISFEIHKEATVALNVNFLLFQKTLSGFLFHIDVLWRE